MTELASGAARHVLSFKVISDIPGQAWVLVLPGGFENFFRTSADVFAQAGSGPPDIGKIMAAAAALDLAPAAPALSRGCAYRRRNSPSR